MEYTNPKRKPNRLKDYDYGSSGAYFITICTKDKKELFSKITSSSNLFDDPTNNLTKYGIIAETEINKIENIYNNVSIDKYVIMPNHIHLIIFLENNGRTQFAPTISRIIKQFKGKITKEIGFTIWQKSFHDHIIRNEKDYTKIWQYIDCNVSKWTEDCFYNPRIIKTISKRGSFNYFSLL